ncbi:MAG: response regulator [Microscillaceae bacterium]|nr:response regulator [Microscillaceae bacterium]
MQNHKHSILYIDDEVSNIDVFKTSFRRDYKVFTALSAQEGLQILDNEMISLVITDQRMPEMSGIEFLKKIIAQYPDMIRIVLTAYSDVEDIIDAINEGGVYQYIRKPWDRNELKMVLDKALEAYQLRRENKKLIFNLQKANENLEEKVKLRTKTLELQNQKLSERHEMIDLLLRELNHRVLNNLQVVTMLLASEGRKSDHTTTKDILEKIEKRVSDLARIHRGLIYRKNDFQETVLEEYFQEIAQLLTNLYASDIPEMHIDIRTHQIKLPQNKAYFLGFIVHELVTNAFKYAFDQEKQPALHIHLQNTDDSDEYCLSISDNGSGFPSELLDDQGEILYEKINSMGLKIIQLICKLHFGTLKVLQRKNGSQGTYFSCELYFNQQNGFTIV